MNGLRPCEAQSVGFSMLEITVLKDGQRWDPTPQVKTDCMLL
jgi:hypothetical protein